MVVVLVVVASLLAMRPGRAMALRGTVVVRGQTWCAMYSTSFMRVQPV